MKKKVTMKDISEALGLSINAVSLALNGKPGVSEDTRRLILSTADKMGYIDFSSRYDKTFSSACICVIIKTKYYHSSFYTKLLYGIETEAKSCGYNIILQFYEENQGVPSCILRRKVCGVIIIGRFEEDYLEMIYRTDLPIVLVDHSSYRLPIDCILTDNKSGVLESVSYLSRAGYRKIGFFGDYSYSNSYKERFDGYLEAMQKIYPDFQQLFAAISRFSVLEQIEDIVLRRDTVGIACILEKMEELPEAFQCANDRNAVLLNNALQLMGRKVPEDVAIVGFDDSDLATVMSPPLTTLHVSTVRMGNKAFSRLLWKMDHREASPERIMMGVRLIIRDST
ncbi:MAG: LacI family DNA-binding transcriptional regulator [Faecousia sp.]